MVTGRVSNRRDVKTSVSVTGVAEKWKSEALTVSGFDSRDFDAHFDQVEESEIGRKRRKVHARHEKRGNEKRRDDAGNRTNGQ